MIRGYTYIDLSLFPVYINESLLLASDIVAVQRYNSSQYMTYVNNSELDNMHKIVRLSNEDKKEDLFNNCYSNFQLITDLFDIILTKQSSFRNKVNESADYMLRRKEYLVDLSTDNRYTARFPKFNAKKFVLIANLKSQRSRTLIEKRQRLNEYL